MTKHLILLRIQIVDVNVDWHQWFIIFFDEKCAAMLANRFVVAHTGTGIKCDNQH